MLCKYNFKIEEVSRRQKEISSSIVSSSLSLWARWNMEERKSEPGSALGGIKVTQSGCQRSPSFPRHRQASSVTAGTQRSLALPAAGKPPRGSVEEAAYLSLFWATQGDMGQR